MPDVEPVVETGVRDRPGPAAEIHLVARVGDPDVDAVRFASDFDPASDQPRPRREPGVSFSLHGPPVVERALVGGLDLHVVPPDDAPDDVERPAFSQRGDFGRIPELHAEAHAVVPVQKPPAGKHVGVGGRGAGLAAQKAVYAVVDPKRHVDLARDIGVFPHVPAVSRENLERTCPVLGPVAVRSGGGGGGVAHRFSVFDSRGFQSEGGSGVKAFGGRRFRRIRRGEQNDQQGRRQAGARQFS